MLNYEYTDEQLQKFADKFKLINIKLKEVFLVIGEKESIALHEINKEVGIGDFVRDKCIAALELSGLIEKYAAGTEKICKITEDGARLVELLNKRGSN